MLWCLPQGSSAKGGIGKFDFRSPQTLGIDLVSDKERTTKVIHDSRRWTGDPKGAAGELPRLQMLQPSDVALPLRLLIVGGWSVMFFGLLRNGYCEHELFYASATFPSGAYTEAHNLKGTIRFVSQIDGQICTVSSYGTVAGAAAFFLLFGAAYAFHFRRRAKVRVRDVSTVRD